MKNVQASSALMRKRKMLLVLPLLVIPFLTMAFWALGGGRGEATKAPTSKGLNLNLPDANLSKSEGDKLSFYDRMMQDSAKLAQWREDKPQSQEAFQTPDSSATAGNYYSYNPGFNPSPYGSSPKKPEDEIMQKLALLQNELAKAPAKERKTVEKKQVAAEDDLAEDVDRLQSMMESMNSPDEDPEMNKIEGVLEKVLDIQHPDRVKERIREKSIRNKQAVYTVHSEASKQSISLLGTNLMDSTKEFFSLPSSSHSADGNAIEAVVHQNQLLVNGAVVKLRLLHDVYINGCLVPQQSFVFGTASLQDERLLVEINSIRCRSSVLPVKLNVYDMDGLPGIHIPGAITRDVAKQSADNSLQMIDLDMMDHSLKAQAASAGLGAAKNLLSRKIKLVKVTVKAGYKVLLKNSDSEQ
jgi:conjugative transposon TraM protein